MILGRPTNLWNGLIVAAVGAVTIIVMQLVPDVDGEAVASVGAAITVFLGAAISLLANQAPTVNAGTQVNVVTPAGEPNRRVTV